MSASNTTHFEIFDYWKDKCIDKNGFVYQNTPDNYKETIEIVTDWGEPECFACGKIIKVESDENYLCYLKNEDYQKIWNNRITKQGLQRAHIIPRALRGSNDPSNIFLLCESCHKRSPDTISRSMFLKWVYKRKKQPSELNLFMQEAAKILKDDYNILFPIFNKDNALNLKTTINTHGGGFSDSTFIYSFVLDALKNRTELCEEFENMFKYFINGKIEELSLRKDNNDNFSDADLRELETYKNILSIYDSYKTLEHTQKGIW